MDLIVGGDGKLVLTKLQAASFHFALFCTVIYVTIRRGEFIEGMWALYAAVAVGHAVVDKASVQISAFKNKQLDGPATPPTP